MDFHGATNTTIDFIIEKYGIETMNEIFKKVGNDVYADIKKQINQGNDLSVFILSLISIQNKNWTELHPEHLKLILEAMSIYDNGSLKKQIIIEILNELKIF